MTDRPTHAYVATALCGCVEGLCVDNRNHRGDVERFVCEQMRYGNDITRLPMAAVPAMSLDRSHGDAPAVPS